MPLRKQAEGWIPDRSPKPHFSEPVAHPSAPPARNSERNNFATSEQDGSPDLDQYPEIQRNEFEATQSIYPDGFIHVAGRRNAWQTRDNLAFEVRIASLHDSEYFTALEFEFPPDYPKVLLKVAVKHIEPAQDLLTNQIEQIIRTFPKVHLGSEVVHEITGAIEDLLSKTALSSIEKQTALSLEEERALREANEREKAQADQELTIRQSESEAASRQQHLAAQVDNTIKRRKGGKPSKMDPHDEPIDAYEEAALEPVKFDQSMTCRDYASGQKFGFKVVAGRSIVLKRKDKKVTIVTPVVDKSIQAPQLLLKDIHLPESLAPKEVLQKTMQEIEDLLESSKTHHHAHVVDLLGYRIEHLSLAGETGEWKLAILSEYAKYGSLADVINITGPISTTRIRSWTWQLLEALKFFDEQGYVHPAVSVNNVLIFATSGGGYTLKLSDGYGTALRDLVVQARTPDLLPAAKDSLWTAPELNGKNPERTAKTCIWDLGVVVLHMGYGIDVKKQYTSPQGCMDGSYMSDPFQDLIEAMCEQTLRHRMNAFTLQSFLFFVKDTDDIFARPSSNMPGTPATRKITNSFISRWETEWEEVEQFGQGGFGTVVKARYKNDGHCYAVKKIECRSSRELTKILTEARLLATLTHSYVVRYYSSWFEDQQSPGPTARNTSRETETYDSIFDLPSMGHDMMEPSFHRNIGPEFISDDDEDRLGYQNPADWVDSEEQAERPEVSVEPSTTDAVPERSILYIQMELCENQTLESLIGQGLPGNIDMTWRIFRKILDGLSFIHSKGVVHRDLKPANIFIDGMNNPKIGDFGLAITGQAATDSNSRSATLTADYRSRGKGTPLYIAPEFEKYGSGEYSSKVDMYALGIIFFEMTYPMPSAMERGRELPLLRQAKHVLPEYFQQEEYRIQGGIIEQLITHDQEARPSAAELLVNPSIPEPFEDEKVQRFLNRLAEADPDQYQKMISNLLAKANTKVHDLAWAATTSSATEATEPSLTMTINDRLREVFRRHGAVESDRQGVFPHAEFYSNAPIYLDDSGLVLQLPIDLTLPFARWIAQQRPDFVKYFCFGTVYRKRLLGQEPRKVPEIDFDFVSYNADDLSLKEAEVIKVLDEVINAFPSTMSRQWTICINHGDLLDLILSFCRIKPEDYAKVKRALSQLNVGDVKWQQMREQLRSTLLNVHETSVTDLARFNLTGPFEEVQSKLLAILSADEVSSKAVTVLARIDDLIQNLRRFGVQTKVHLSPLSNNSEQLYRGSLMFQCVENKGRRILAAGGRYDSLIRDYQTKSSQGHTRAVGFRLNVVDLISYVKPANTITSGKSGKQAARESVQQASVTRCDVLLTSFDPTALHSMCPDIVQELWKGGLRAEITEFYGSMEQLDIAYKNDPNYWVVIVRPGSGLSGGHFDKAFKVRSPLKEETEVRRSELLSFLQSEIVDRPQPTYEGPPAKLKRSTSTGYAERPQGAIQVLTPSHKSKKVNRQTIMDMAVASVQELTERHALEAPVLAIDSTDEILQAMRNTRLADDLSWRTLQQSAPMQERAYLGQIRDLLENWQGQGKEGAFVFSYRTRNCIFYAL